MTEKNRRDFLKSVTLTAGITSAAVSAPAISRAKGANDRIQLGFIGTGRMGLGNISTQKDTKQVDIVAVCDVYEPNLKKALDMTEGKAQAYKDFRKLLERKDIDAVVISTPDHWHALQTTLACEAGKDVFVEKPSSLTVGEGRRMVEVARRTNRVVQVGTMQRSAEHFQDAVDIVRSGILGKISFVRTWNVGNEYPNGIGNPPDSEPPKELDWDLWLGPAPMRPFNQNRFGVAEDRWSTFRYFWDYAGGMLTDWGVHLIDIVIWAMKVDSPKFVSASGGKYFVTDNRDTPDTLQVQYDFDDWILTYTNQACNSRGFDKRSYGILFYGSDASLFVDRSRYELIPEYERRGDESVAKRVPLSRESRSSGNKEHALNFLECIKTREKPICDIEIGHRSTSLPLLGNIALWTKQRLQWDGVKEKFVNNPEADKHLMREYRKPWALPKA